MTRATSAPILSLIIIGLIVACSEPVTTALVPCAQSTPNTCEPPPVAVTDFVVARDRWTAHRPPSYEFTLTLSCFCGPEVRRPAVIAVTGTTVTSRTYADDGTSFPAQYASAFPSIDGLFDMLADAGSRPTGRAVATYDSVTGYPLTISLDYAANVADDESYYVVSGFKVR